MKQILGDPEINHTFVPILFGYLIFFRDKTRSGC